MKHSVDKIVKDKLSSFEKEPPGYVWSAINDQMLDIRRRKRVLVFWQSVAAAAILILFLGIIHTVFNNNIDQQQIAETTKATSGTQQPVKNITSENNTTNTAALSGISNEKNNPGRVSKKNNTGGNAPIEDLSGTTQERTTARNSSAGEKMLTAYSTPSNKRNSSGKTLKKNSREGDIRFADITNASQGTAKNKDSAEKKTLVANTTAKTEISSVNQVTSANNPYQEKSLAVNELLIPKTFTGHPELNSKSLTTPLTVKTETPQIFYAVNTPVNTNKHNIRKHKFVITGSASPTYSYRNLGNSQSDAAYSSGISSLDESGIVSFGGGVNLRMESRSRWSFETGVLYSQVGQEVTQNNVYPSVAGMSSLAALYSASNSLKDASVMIPRNDISSLGEIDFNHGTNLAVEKGLQKSGVYLAAPVETLDRQPTSLKQILDYVEIPLIARYELFNKKPIITVAGGVSTNFLVNNSAYLIENGERLEAGTTEGINNITYSSSFGIGIEYPLGKAFRLSLEPKFKYFLSPVNSKGFNNFHPYSFGVFGGISFIINNH